MCPGWRKSALWRCLSYFWWSIVHLLPLHVCFLSFGRNWLLRVWRWAVVCDFVEVEVEVFSLCLFGMLPERVWPIGSVFLLGESERQGRSWWFYFVSGFSLFAIHCCCEDVCWFRIRRLRWIIGGGWLSYVGTVCWMRGCYVAFVREVFLNVCW